MEYSFGTIQVEAEVIEDERDSIATLQELKQRYSYLRKKQKEHLYAVYLNNSNEIIGDKLISLGQSVKTSLDVRDVARTAVLTDASAVILVHNHCSSNCEPSSSDLTATEEVQTALETFDVQLLDHLIISKEGSYSFKAEGDL
ncbi:MAG: DNA repair protein RadC [Candidatus Nanohaloarchaea archaeon]|jgi:DNA repair protein RadC